MGNSTSKDKSFYYISIYDLLTDKEDKKMFLYSNLTEDLDDIENFLLGNHDSMTSKLIRKEIDNWFDTNKMALNDLQRDNLDYEKQREIPVTLYDINRPLGLYLLTEDDDSMHAEIERDERMRDDRQVIVDYKVNPNPHNLYIYLGFNECNNIEDFFDKSRYSKEYNKEFLQFSTGFEYFFYFYNEFMNREFTWKGFDYKPLPFVIEFREGNGILKPKKTFSNEMNGLSPKDWKQS